LYVDGKKDTKKAKGVKNNVVARSITFNDYAMSAKSNMKAIVYKIKIARDVHDIGNENRSKSIRR